MPNTVAVIIPTKNRSIDLGLTFESIIRQSILPNQIIVVDQSEDDESCKQVEKLYREARSQVRDVVRLDSVRDPGISGGAVARNRAMEIARGDIWLFLDDDVILEPNFVEELLAVYQQHPHVLGVSGIISNYHKPHWAYLLWAIVFLRGPFHDERQPIYWNANRLRKTEPIQVGKFTGALMSFRAEAIRANRFDENLIGVSDGEDVDFCARLGSDPFLVIAPRARLIHKKSAVGRTQDHWLRRFAQANYYLYHRNWQSGIRNRLAFVWLNVGLGVAAFLASVQRGTLAPWGALREGARDGMRVGRLKIVAHRKAAEVTANPARFGWRL